MFIMAQNLDKSIVLIKEQLKNYGTLIAYHAAS